MGIWLPEAAHIFEPNLLYPKSQFVGPVEINWDHPGAKGLEVCAIPRLREDKFTLVNLVDGSKMEATGVDKETYIEKARNSGKLALNKKKNSTGSPGEFDTTFYPHGVRDVTILYESKQITDSDAEFLETTESSPTAWSGIQLRRDADLTQVKLSVCRGWSRGSPVGQKYYITDPITPGIDAPYTTYRWLCTPYLLHAWINGVKINTYGSQSGASADIYTNGTEPLTIFPDRNLNTGDMAMTYLYVWSCRVDKALISSIERDPYQFLKPAGT